MFDDTAKKVQKHFADKSKACYELRRRRWFISDMGSASYVDMLKLFDTDVESTEYNKLVAAAAKPSAAMPDLRKMLPLQAKIGWLCGWKRDLRIQFACGKDSRPREANDSRRFCGIVADWISRRVIQRMRDVFTVKV